MVLRVTILLFSFCLSVQLIAQADCPRAENPVTLISPTIVGTGALGSCTSAAIQAALDIGGHINCNCGPDATVTITTPLVITQSTVLEGNGLTLDGNSNSRIIYKNTAVDLTVQNLNFINGKAPGNGNVFNQCGGAILVRQLGILKVINCNFENNTVTSTNASDVAGGAVYVFGQRQGIFSNCTFTGNSASNGGAIGGLGSDIIIAYCTFTGNAALGSAGGLRGHGGAINLDGVEITAIEKIYSVCGSTFIGNNGYAQGGASNTVFSDNVGAKLEIDQCYYEGNYLRAPDAGNGGAIFHVVDDANSGYNELQFTITRSSFVGNHCNRHGGGVWALLVGQGIIENCTFYKDSTAHSVHGLGGAVALGVSTSGQGGYLIRNNTFARNYAGLWAGAVFANSAAPVTWQNNIMLNNYTSNSNPWLDLNVNREMNVDLGGNIQWPPTRPNGTTDKKATPTSQYLDAQLILPPSNLGGSTPTIALSCTSPAIGLGSGCPTTDQRLAIRSTCDLGAYAFDIPGTIPNVTVSGPQSGTQFYNATNSITSNAVIAPSGQVTMTACTSIILNSGFEVQAGGRLGIW